MMYSRTCREGFRLCIEVLEPELVEEQTASALAIIDENGGGCSRNETSICGTLVLAVGSSIAFTA